MRLAALYRGDPPKYLLPGDTVSIEITAIGELVNTVAAGLATS